MAVGGDTVDGDALAALVAPVAADRSARLTRHVYASAHPVFCAFLLGRHGARYRRRPGSMNVPRAPTQPAKYTFKSPEGLLAHYTGSSTVFEHILPLGQLKASPYREMRDPFENKDVVPTHIAWDHDPSEPGQAVDEFYEQLRQARDRLRVLSFSRDAQECGGDPRFDCCWSRPRMWEQYGDRHRGVCLLLDRPDLERMIHAAWPSDRIYLRNVEYTREGIAGSTLRDCLRDERIFTGHQRASAVFDYLDGHYHELFFLKNADFATEYEYRVVMPAGDDDYVDCRDAVVGVVLGERFPAWQRPSAVAFCSDLGLELRQMAWRHGHPSAVQLSL